MSFDLREVEAGITADALLRVRNFLFTYQGEWIVSKKIAQACGLPHEETCVLLRRTIKVLQNAGYPIVSSTQGFMWAMDKDTVLLAITRETERLHGLQQHISDLQRIYVKMGGSLHYEVGGE